jgi:hypothetical protein
VIVIQRNGRTTVITGWRAWLLGAVLFVGLTLLMAVLAFVVLGIAVTLGAVLLIAFARGNRRGDHRVAIPAEVPLTATAAARRALTTLASACFIAAKTWLGGSPTDVRP